MKGGDDPMKLTCPMPASASCVTMAHGGGGRMMQRLIGDLILPTFDNPWLQAQGDGALLDVGGARIAFTTDSYVVHPHQFPGGDIGRLAVFGTANDLAMCAARPLYLSVGLILEEGLPFDKLEAVLASMKRAADEAHIHLVTGDTKVVERGKGDGIYINTSGLGLIESPTPCSPSSVRPGDVLILSGDVGRHGIAVMASREGLAFETTLESDCAALWPSVEAMLQAGLSPRCLRDLTRGGLSAGLVEIASASGAHLHIRERDVPVCDAVRGACEILGLDPLQVANEGRFLAIVAPEESKDALDALRDTSPGALEIGVVEEANDGGVTLTSTIGVRRILDLPSGAALPRIC